MSREDLTGRTIAGYRLQHRLGEGGSATVYRAEHPEHGRCAVKVLKQRLRDDPTAVKRFLREAEYGSRVEHPALVRTYDFGEEDGFDYLALEWVEGEPLAKFATRSGRIAPELVGHIIDQLCDGLTATHAVGIIHRDLKPENIVYNPKTRAVKLLDFGIARDAQEDAAERLTRDGFFVGTLNYVAPEALSGELVSEAADIYSVATITYYLLTGRHPYTGQSQRELFRQLLAEAPTPLNEAVKGLRFSKRLEDAVMTGLAREPKNRQPTIRKFEAAVLAGVATETDEAQPTGEKRSIFGAIRSLLGGAAPGERG